HLDTVLVVVNREQQQNAAIALLVPRPALVADSPLGSEFNGKVLDRPALQRLHCYDGELCVGFVIEFPGECLQTRFALRADYTRKVAYISRRARSRHLRAQRTAPHP